ncbi:MAG: TonB family protein [Saprospiraceae bacterium]|nr:TonB family protein [Saprospiraceae bacterium]
MKKSILIFSLASVGFFSFFTPCKNENQSQADLPYSLDDRTIDSLNEVYAATISDDKVIQVEPKARLVSYNDEAEQLAMKYQLKGEVYKASEVDRVAIYEPECLANKKPIACSSEKVYDFMTDEIRYPRTALNNRIETVSYIQFVIDKSGNISDTKFVSHRGERCEACEQEALKAFSKMHQWVPAQKGGKDVAVEMTLPVRFAIEEI